MNTNKGANVYPKGYWWNKERLDTLLQERTTMTLRQLAAKYNVCPQYIRYLEHRANNWNTRRIQERLKQLESK
jgi:hypothetical protein